DGGGVLFAGACRYYRERLEHRRRRAMGSFGMALLSKAAVCLPPVKGRHTLQRLGMAPDAACASKHCGCLFDGMLKAHLYSDGLRASCLDYDPSAMFRAYYNRSSSGDPLDKALDVDIQTYLADDILVKLDRSSMAHALEVRAPLLDHKFLEFTATLPSSLKLQGRTTKVLLKRILNGRVPAEVTTRAKHGFTMPIAEWLRGDLRERVEDCLFSPRSVQRGLFNQAMVRTFWTHHRTPPRYYSHHLKCLLTLSFWSRRLSSLRSAALSRSRRPGIARLTL